MGSLNWLYAVFVPQLRTSGKGALLMPMCGALLLPLCMGRLKGTGSFRGCLCGCYGSAIVMQRSCS
eukprot:2506843-Amphidinium_carterae.1